MSVVAEMSVENERDEARAQLAALAEAARGCGNKPCILHIGPYTSQHTNGGCHCRERIADVLADLPSAGRELVERIRYDAERRVVAEMNGTPSARIAGLRRRARELIEREPKEALANIIAGLADDPEHDAAVRAAVLEEVATQQEAYAKMVEGRPLADEARIRRDVARGIRVIASTRKS